MSDVAVSVKVLQHCEGGKADRTPRSFVPREVEGQSNVEPILGVRS